MATDNLPQGAQQPRDYLGHPCRVNEAFERFAENVQESRKLEQKDLVRQIGIDLNALVERSRHPHAAMQMARKALNNPDSEAPEQVQSVLTMALAYNVDTDNLLGRLAGHVLVALERGKLVEVANG